MKAAAVAKNEGEEDQIPPPSSSSTTKADETSQPSTITTEPAASEGHPKRGRSRSRERHGRRSRSRSSSVDSLGRVKRKRVDDRERSRSRERSQGRNGKTTSLKSAAEEEEEAEHGAVLPAPSSSAAPDTRVMVKIFAEAPKEVTLAPPPPRRRKHSGNTPTAAGGGASSSLPATSPPTITSSLQKEKVVGVPAAVAAPHEVKPSEIEEVVASVRKNTADETDFETEEERERREEAERRARREKLLAKIGPRGATPPPITSPSPPPPPPASPSPVSTKKTDAVEDRRQGKKEEQKAISKKEEGIVNEDPKAKEARLRNQLLRKLMTEARKKREEAAGSEAAEDTVDGDDGGGVVKIDQAAQGGLLKRGDEGATAAVAAMNGEGGEKKAAASTTGGHDPSSLPLLDIFAASGPEIAALGGALQGGSAAGLKPLNNRHAVAEQRDEEGYFKHRLGEKIRGRYKVLGTKGRGVFSSVILAQDEKNKGQEVAIKVLRGNELMLQAGLKELELLKEITKADPKGQAHCVRVLDEFRLGGHICIVMEAMNMNLRKLLKTYGSNQGIAIKAVLSYTKQLMAGLQHLHRHQIVHADLKPDNIVVNAQMNVLKICDFGSAMKVADVEDLDDAPYLQSRFYRAPEVILGYNPRGTAMDLWSAATTLYEIYTSKLLFTGRHNNELLKNVMELRGPIPRKLLKKASLRSAHFDDDLNFLSRELDRVTKKETIRCITNITTTRNLGELLIRAGGGSKAPQEVKISIELLRSISDQCLVLDPAKRITAAQALALFKTSKK